MAYRLCYGLETVDMGFSDKTSCYVFRFCSAITFDLDSNHYIFRSYKENLPIHTNVNVFFFNRVLAKNIRSRNKITCTLNEHEGYRQG